MTPMQALNMLATLASTSRQQPTSVQVLHLKQVILDALNTDRTDLNQLKALKAEKLELTFRVAELEEELAEAKKPKRRRTTRKKNDDSSGGDTTSS